MAAQKKNRGLRFCPQSNDLLYPRENTETRRLEYFCKNCPYVEEAALEDYCVYTHELKHDAKEQTIVLQDISDDPTLPRTHDVRCPECGHTEAVFYSQSSEQGMTLYFSCVNCKHRWKDDV
jgi:DNA-directed RNA polymerase II subunit RPB9